MEAKVILGPEHDERLSKSLDKVLTKMGASFELPIWTMGGSQEVITRYVTLDGVRLKIEAETYIGLSLSGDRHIVETIARQVSSL